MSEKPKDVSEKEEENLTIKESRDNTNLPAKISNDTNLLERTSDYGKDSLLDSISSSGYLKQLEKLRNKALTRSHAFQLLEVIFLLMLFGTIIFVFVVWGDVIWPEIDSFGLVQFIVVISLGMHVLSSALNHFGARVLHDVCEFLFFSTSSIISPDRAWRALGGIMVRRKNYNRAIKYYKKAISKNLDTEYRVDSEIFLDYSYAAMKAGFIKDATKFGDKACRIADSLLDAKGSRMGEALQQNLQFHAQCYLKYGVVLAKTGDYERAEKFLARSLQSGLQSSFSTGDSIIETYRYLVEVSFLMRKTEALSPYCKEAEEFIQTREPISFERNNGSLIFCKALLALTNEDFEGAESLFIEAARIEIKSGRFEELGQCYYYLGALYYRTDDLSLAKKYFELVREIFQESYANPSGYYRKSTLALIKIMSQDSKYAPDVAILEKDIERSNFEYKRVNG